MYFFNIPFPYIIVGALLLAFLLRRLVPQLFKQNASIQEKLAKDEEQYFINSNQLLPGAGFKAGRLVKQILIAALLWVIPFGIFYNVSADYDFWKELSLFFTKAAFVTFGGAYAVLPYVAQVSVEQLNWLTELQMSTGYGFGICGIYGWL